MDDGKEVEPDAEEGLWPALNTRSEALAACKDAPDAHERVLAVCGGFVGEEPWRFAVPMWALLELGLPCDADAPLPARSIAISLGRIYRAAQFGSIRIVRAVCGISWVLASRGPSERAELCGHRWNSWRLLVLVELSRRTDPLTAVVALAAAALLSYERYANGAEDVRSHIEKALHVVTAEWPPDKLAVAMERHGFTLLAVRPVLQLARHAQWPTARRLGYCLLRAWASCATGREALLGGDGSVCGAVVDALCAGPDADARALRQSLRWVPSLVSQSLDVAHRHGRKDEDQPAAAAAAAAGDLQIRREMGPWRHVDDVPDEATFWSDGL